MYKRIISFVLAVVMCLSIPMTGILASTTPTPVTDVGKSNYAVAKQTELESILLLQNEPREDGSGNMLPLDIESDKVAIFGNGQRAPISGSSGSGTVTGAFTYTLIEGMNEIGATYNETVAAYYELKKTDHGWNTDNKTKWGAPQYSGTGWNMSSPIAAPELKIDDGQVKDDGLVTGAVTAGANAAVVYLQRQVGTEEMDRASNPLQPSDWYLNPSEYTLLKQVTDKFDDVIVIINTSGSIDMSWLSFDWLTKDPDYNDGGTIDAAEAASRAEKIRSIVWMYGAGSYHGLALAELLYGIENFSAKLADTITYKYENHYTSDKFGGNQTYKENGTKNGFGNNGKNYNTRWGENDPAIIYSEYVYTGYRYFDTFMGDKAGTAEDPVLFEFGFGKSYSDFEFSDFNVSFDAATESFNVSAKITNISADGSLPSGKEVMEVYLSAPNDQTLDQPYQILVGYDKTQKLAKGESETLTVNVPAYYMASYDEATASYVLEEGDFYFRVGNSSRNTRIAGVVTTEEKITVEQLTNKLTLNDAGSDQNQAEFDSVRLNSQTKSGKTLVNPNDTADIAACGHLTLAQSDIETTTAAYDTEYTAGTAPEDAAYTLQAVMNGEITIENFAAQLTKDELSAFLSGGSGIYSSVGGNPYRYYSDDAGVNLTDTASKPSGSNVRSGGAGTSRNIQRLGIPSVTYADGSAGISISSSLANNVNYDANAGYNRAAGAACTWNPELQYKWGQALGNDMLAINVDILLAPSLNLHRNPLNGRNTEYYSEDPMLTGLIASNVASGVASRGVTVCLKHFAGNDQEQYRRGFYTNASVDAGTSKDASNTISSERALRETTLRAFEIPVKTSEVHTVMSAFNKINSQECAASSDLLTDILRGEWGFDGYVVTDWGDFDDIAHAANEMRSGNDMIMSGKHERYSIPDQLYYGIVDEYDMESENPYGGRDDGLVSMADLQRNAKNVLTTIMNSAIAFDSDGNYNLGYINGSSIPYHVERDLSILTTKLPIALVGVDYSDYKTNPILATGSEGTTYYKFSVADSSVNKLPNGLALAGNGTITGTPAPGSAGYYNITFQVEDSFGNTATKALTLEVADVAITTDSIGNPRIGLEYSQQLTAAGGTAPYTFSVDTVKGNALPKGLTLDENTGLISGTPDDPSEIGKTFYLVLTVEDSEGSTGVLTTEIELIDYVTMTFGSFTSPTVLAKGEDIGYAVASFTRADGDIFTVTINGLPPGMYTINFGSMTLVMGSAMVPGEYTTIFTVKVNGTDISVDIPFTFIIYDAGDDLKFISDTLPTAKKNENYSTMVPVVGGTGAKTFTLAEDSETPNGLKLNESTGQITWTPGASQYGLHKLVIHVTDSSLMNIEKTFWLQVDAGISMSPATGTEFELKTGEAFEQQITAAGYSTSMTYHVSSKGDNLPAGMTLTTEGTLRGTPLVTGIYNVIIEAKEVGGALSGAMAAYKLVVGQGDVKVGGTFDVNLTCIDWGEPVTSVTVYLDEALPEGVTVADVKNAFRVDLSYNKTGYEFVDGSWQVIQAPVQATRVITGAVISEDRKTVTLEFETNFGDESTTNAFSMYHIWLVSDLGNMNATTHFDYTDNRVSPAADKWGRYEKEDTSIALDYRMYAPDVTDDEEIPLIVWLHGAGEFTTDNNAQLTANYVTNWASDEVQSIFGGKAYVVAPQTSNLFNNETGQMGHNPAEIMEVIQYVIDNNPNIDLDRIYIGGCSMGGKGTWDTILAYPDFFAAAFPICPYTPTPITVEQAATVAQLPIYQVSSINDGAADASWTIKNYQSLIEAGAANAHITLFNGVVYDGNTYDGHFSWVYAHRNFPNSQSASLMLKTPVSFTSANGTVVTGAVSESPSDIGYDSFMHWIAAQSKEEDAEEYTVTYNPNGGTGSGYSVTVNSGSAHTVLNATDSNLGYARDGYAFKGWNTEADGSGTSYAAGAQITVNGNVTLYAQWDSVIPTYTVTYKPNGGLGSSYSVTVTSPNTHTVLEVTNGNLYYTRSGYVFSGWNTKPDGTGASYSAGAELNVSGNITLYAQWVAIFQMSYVYYKPNGGTGSTHWFDVGYTHTVLSNSDLGYTRSGYTFTGWNTKADGSGTSYAAGSSITVTGKVDLYAQWKAEEKLPFTDVKEADWFYSAVSYVYRTDLFKGTDATTFDPQKDMTREMFVTVLSRMAKNMGEDISGNTLTFKDVPRGEWYSDAIAWGAAKGILKGYSNDTFGLGDKITREQMAVLFVRYANYAKIKLDDSAKIAFSDASSISSWAAADVDTAAKAGLFIGDDGKFQPKRTATRAEAAQVFERFASMYINK